MDFKKPEFGRWWLLLLLLGFAAYPLAVFFTGGDRDWLRSQADEVQELGELAALVNKMADRTQKELELTAAFLDSGGRQFGDRLLVQRGETDRLHAALNDFLARYQTGHGNPELADKLEQALTGLAFLDPVRQQADTKTISATEANLYYAEATQKFQALIPEIALANPHPFCGC